MRNQLTPDSLSPVLAGRQQAGALRALCLSLVPCLSVWSAPVFSQVPNNNELLERAVSRAVAEAASREPSVAPEAGDSALGLNEIVDVSRQHPQMLARLSGATGADAGGGFNMAFLHGGDATSSVRTLLGTSGTTEGVQRVDIYVNQSRVGRRDVDFLIDPATDEVEPCFTADLLKQFGVDAFKLPVELDREAQCLRLAEVVPQASVRFDTASLRLELGVPQLYMAMARRGYVDPSLWDDGANVAFLGYTVNGRRSQGQGYGARSTLNSGLHLGLNVGPWRLRNDSSVTSGSGRGTDFSSQNTYAQRGVRSLKSTLVLGQTYTYSPLFDSVRFLGARMASDDAMRPDDEQGYAPVIRGSASSNATIEIRQNGYLIHTSTVSAGPFEIHDLAPSGANGDLEISVIEADGSRQVTRQAFYAPPLMVREGRFKYDLAGGEVRLSDHQRVKPAFFGGSMLYGIGPDSTIAGGAQIAENFQAYSLGLGLNSRLGALSLNGTHSRSLLDDRWRGGQRWELRYARFVQRTGTNVSFNARRDLDRDYRTLAAHVLEREWQSDFDAAYHGGQSSRQRFDASIAQPIGSGNFYLSGSHGRNWDGSSSRSVSAGYSNQIGRGTYNLSYTNSRNLFVVGDRSVRRDDMFMLSINMPLGARPRAPRAYASVGHQGGGNSVQAGLAGSLPITDQEVSYSVTAGRDGQGRSSGAFALGATTPVARVSASYTHSSTSDVSTVSASGVIVAHGGGVNLGQSVSETFMLAKVKPSVAGVGISNFAGVRTGRNGYAVIPNAMPYRGNWVGLDARGTTAGVDVDTAMQQVVPTRGAVVLATFSATRGRRVQFELRQSDGSRMPFGTTVENEKGERLGITDPRGRALVLLPDDHTTGTLKIHREGYGCSVGYVLPQRDANQNYQRLELQCAEAEIRSDIGQRGGVGSSVTAALVE